jgi:glutathione S-transferase
VPQDPSLRGLWILEEAGQPYEKELIDIRAGAQSTAAYHAINPMEKVPAIADGEARVAESAAICAYVAERYPDAGLAPPVGDPLRGRYLQWMAFSAGCVEPAFTQKMTKIQIPPMAAGWGDFDRVFNVIDEAVAKGPWILGERFSAADVMIGGDLFFGINVLKIVEPKPASAAYVARCISRPAFQRAQRISEG